MSDSPFLPSAPRAHRLPPRWDGSTVEWGEWQADNSTLRFHVRPEPCPYCGSIAARVMAHGKVRADGPALALHRSRGYRLGRLFAFRCPDCWHDQVIDLAGVVWDLDDSDYTDEGSWNR